MICSVDTARQTAPHHVDPQQQGGYGPYNTCILLLIRTVTERRRVLPCVERASLYLYSERHEGPGAPHSRIEVRPLSWIMSSCQQSSLVRLKC